MARWWLSVLLAIATIVVLVEARAIPAEPISLMLDAYGNPVMFLREKRTPVQPYSQRAMMITGYYRPVRRSDNGGQATGVFAQGNAVSGEAFFGGMQAPHLKHGPEPIDEQEVSSAEAQAAPEPDDSFNETSDNEDEARIEEERQDQPEIHPHHRPEEHRPSKPHHRDQEGAHHHRHEQEGEHHQHRDDAQGQHDTDSSSFGTEAPAVPAAEEPIAPSTEATVHRIKPDTGKKTKKTPVVVEDDYEEDEADEEDDEPLVPFVPFKGNRRRQNYPHLNNFFPMVFSFPGAATRAGSSGSPPGAVTAIANSYSTGKGGVASSVATAYGGSPNGKKRKAQPLEE